MSEQFNHRKLEHWLTLPATIALGALGELLRTATPVDHEVLGTYLSEIGREYADLPATKAMYE